MNIFTDFRRRASWPSIGGRLCLFLMLVASSGCKKSDSAPGPVAPPPESNSQSSVAAPTAAPVVAPTAAAVVAPTAAAPSGLGQPSLPSTAVKGLTQLQLINRALMGWVMANHRHPRTFEEFASTSNYQIPPPPAGQKYALNGRGFVILVNSTQ